MSADNNLLVETLKAATKSVEVNGPLKLADGDLRANGS